MNPKQDIINDFLLGSDAQGMHDLPDHPDLPVVHQGVNLKINLGNLIGGWALTKEGPRVVWFIKLTDGIFHRLKG